jgi:hypothetical protein
MKWRTFLLVLVCAVLSFGGSFTCTTHSGDHDHHDDHHDHNNTAVVSP